MRQLVGPVDQQEMDGKKTLSCSGAKRLGNLATFVPQLPSRSNLVYTHWKGQVQPSELQWKNLVLEMLPFSE